MANVGLSFRDTAKAITSFFEVAIHTILRIRQVYPADLFVRRKKYDAPVYQSRHPALNEYITGAVKAIGEELVMGAIDKVVIVIKDQLNRPLERFVFSIRSVLDVDPDDVDKPVANAITAHAIELYFRAFLIKLSMMESTLGDFLTTDDLTFAIVLECRDGNVPMTTQDDEPSPWVPATKSHVSNETTTEGAQLHVIKSLETGVINMTLSIQESNEKLARQRQILDDTVDSRTSSIPSKDKGKGKML